MKKAPENFITMINDGGMSETDVKWEIARLFAEWRYARVNGEDFSESVNLYFEHTRDWSISSVRLTNDPPFDFTPTKLAYALGGFVIGFMISAIGLGIIFSTSSGG